MLHINDIRINRNRSVLKNFRRVAGKVLAGQLAVAQQCFGADEAYTNKVARTLSIGSPFGRAPAIAGERVITLEL